MLLMCFDIKLNKPNSLGVASVGGGVKLEHFNEASMLLTCWVKERVPKRHPASLL